jgi:cytoskeletal protein CcmA (bactofilin family)
MFNKPDRRASDARGAGRKSPRVASLLGEDIVLEGNLSAEGDLHLDGLVRGDVRVSRLTLGVHGCVEGAVTAETVEVHGRVIGAITARQVHLYAGAEVNGDLSHEELTIDAGAVFQGRSLRLGAHPGPPVVIPSAAAEAPGASSLLAIPSA